jgi:hypothetical protein
MVARPSSAALLASSASATGSAGRDSLGRQSLRALNF